MKLELKNNQPEVLELISKEIKDEFIREHVYSAVEYNFYHANEYDVLKQVGQYGMWIKLKNDRYLHILLVDINLFHGRPLIKIRTKVLRQDVVDLLPDTEFWFDEEGYTWWIQNPEK